MTPKLRVLLDQRDAIDEEICRLGIARAAVTSAIRTEHRVAEARHWVWRQDSVA